MIMRRQLFLGVGGVAVGSVCSHADGGIRSASPKADTSMDITRHGTQPSRPAPEAYFTGTVQIDAPFRGTAPSRVGGATVTFGAGARNAWHTHPLGQTLIVTTGVGRVRKWGGPVEEIRPGDVVWFEPEEKHWHGASPTVAMTHIAIQEALNGKVVDWMEKVSDEQYDGKGN
jgi:quercetin dioxygenase-like cupin family protein